MFLMQAMSFDEFARQLRTVFDTMAKRGEKILVEKEGLLFIMLRKSQISGQTMIQRRFERC
jgi:hypothetical protein